MIFDENKVKFTGTEYLAYKKYIDSKPKNKLKEYHYYFIISGILALILILGIVFYIDAQTYVPYSKMDWNSILKTCFSSLTMMLGLGLMIGWIIHGVGFVIIKHH